jgi:hypothetical protein
MLSRFGAPIVAGSEPTRGGESGPKRAQADRQRDGRWRAAVTSSAQVWHRGREATKESRVSVLLRACVEHKDQQRASIQAVPRLLHLFVIPPLFTCRSASADGQRAYVSGLAAKAPGVYLEGLGLGVAVSGTRQDDARTKRRP